MGGMVRRRIVEFATIACKAELEMDDCEMSEIVRRILGGNFGIS